MIANAQAGRDEESGSSPFEEQVTLHPKNANLLYAGVTSRLCDLIPDGEEDRRSTNRVRKDRLGIACWCDTNPIPDLGYPT